MVSRFRGGVAKETFLLKIRDFNDVETAEFHEGDRSGTSNGATLWTDLTLNDYIWEWESGRPSTLEILVDDPTRALFDDTRRGFKARLALDNPMKGCVLAWDMETIDVTGNIQDLSLTGNDGLITGATDVPGFWGRSRLFDAETEKIRATGFNFDGFTAWGQGATVRIGNMFATRLEQTITDTAQASGDAQGRIMLTGPSGGLPNNIKIQINTSVQGFQTIDRPFTFVLGETYTIFVTWDGSNVRVNVDGVQVGDLQAASGTLATSTFNFTVGHQGGAGDSFTFNERIDEIIVYKDRAPGSTEVAESYKRRGRAPRYYFDGRVRKKKHQDGVTTLSCVDNLVDAVDQEIYDLIFEGMETDDNTLSPAAVFPHFSDRQLLDVNFNISVNLVHWGVPAEHNGGGLILNGSRTYSPILKVPRIKFVDNATLGVPRDNFHVTGPDFQFHHQRINPTGTSPKIRGIAFDINYNDVVDGDYAITLSTHDTVANTIIEIATKTFSSESPASSSFGWTYHDFSDITIPEIESGNQLLVGIEPAINQGWTVANPLEWRVSQPTVGNHIGFIVETDTGLTIVDGQTGSHYVIMDGEWQTLREDRDFEYLAAGAAFRIFNGTAVSTPRPSGSLPGRRRPGTLTGDKFGFVEASYFYSMGGKKVKDVLERILARVGLTGVFTLTGGLSSDAANVDLGFYAPQGGTAEEHIKSLAALTNDRPRFVPPNFIQFQRWPEPNSFRNNSFELFTPNRGIGGNSFINVRDWNGFLSDVNSSGAAISRDASQQFSGTYSAKINTAGTAGKYITMYTDVEDFDPVASGTGGNNMVVRIRPGAQPSEATLSIRLSDYGSFANEIVLSTDVLTAFTAGQWTKKSLNIQRSSFRISFRLNKDSAISGQASNVFLDDLIAHPENQRGFFLVDAKEKDADYTSGFLPGTRTTDTSIGVHLLDDYSTGPRIVRETSRKMVNNSVVLGRRSETSFGEPILAIARNPARASIHGDRSKVIRQESVSDAEDAYLRAKKQVRFDATFRTSLNMVGQFPFLAGRLIRMFFPQDGIANPMSMEATGITVDSKRSLVRFNLSVTEQFVDVEKLQEREAEMSGSFEVDLSDSLLYFTTVDLPTTVSPAAVAEARLKDEAGGTSDYKTLEAMDTRDGSVNNVWRLVIGPRDGDTFDTSGSDVWDRIDIEDSSKSDPPLATITFDQEFAKTPNMWIVVWIYAQ